MEWSGYNLVKCTRLANQRVVWHQISTQPWCHDGIIKYRIVNTDCSVYPKYLCHSEQVKYRLAAHVGSADDILLSARVASGHSLGRCRGDGLGKSDQILCCSLASYDITAVKCLESRDDGEVRTHIFILDPSYSIILWSHARI